MFTVQKLGLSVQKCMNETQILLPLLHALRGVNLNEINLVQEKCVCVCFFLFSRNVNCIEHRLCRDKSKFANPTGEGPYTTSSHVYTNVVQAPLNKAGDIPGHRRPRPGGPPWHNFHPVSAPQRLCEYSKTIAIHSPSVFHRLIKSSVYPTALCHSTATPGVCNGSQLPVIVRLSTRLVRCLLHVSFEESLRQLFSLEGRRLRAGLFLAFRIFKGKVDVIPSSAHPEQC